MVLLLALGGCQHHGLPTEFNVLGSGVLGQGTDVTLIMDKSKIASPAEIAPDRAMILITIDTSSYKGEQPVHAIFDMDFARRILEREQFGTLTHTDKKNQSHGTITGNNEAVFTCGPRPKQTTLSQAPGLSRDYVLSLPAGWAFFTLKEAATVKPYLRDRPSRVFDYHIPGLGVGGPIDLGTFRIQGPEGAASITTDDARGGRGIVHWGDIRFRAPPMVYEITPPPIVWETECLNRPGF